MKTKNKKQKHIICKKDFFCPKAVCAKCLRRATVDKISSRGQMELKKVIVCLNSFICCVLKKYQKFKFKN